MFSKWDRVLYLWQEWRIDNPGKRISSIWIGEEHKLVNTEDIELLQSFEEIKKESLEKANSIVQFRTRAKEMYEKILPNKQ